jgi:hypothetical protein
VNVHFDGFFFFLAHLTLVRVEALGQVEDPVAIHAQRSAFRTDDLGSRLSIFVISAKRLQRTT